MAGVSCNYAVGGRTVLVTGASGGIGRRVVRELLSSDPETVVRAVSRRDPGVHDPRVRWVFKDLQVLTDAQAGELCADVTAVIHLAAQLPLGRFASSRDRRTLWETNVTATERLARAAVSMGVQSFVLASTVGVYGQLASEQPLSIETPTAPTSAYAVSKLQAESIVCEECSRSRRSGGHVVRLPAVYGPDCLGTYSSLAGWIRRGLPVPVARTVARRSLISASNAASILVHASRRFVPGSSVSQAHDGFPLPLQEVFTCIADGLGVPSRSVRFPLSAFAVQRSGVLPGPLKQLMGSLELVQALRGPCVGWAAPEDGRAALVAFGSDLSRLLAT